MRSNFILNLQMQHKQLQRLTTTRIYSKIDESNSK